MATTIPQKIKLLSDELNVAVYFEETNNYCEFKSRNPTTTSQNLSNAGIKFEEEGDIFTIALSGALPNTFLFLNLEIFLQRIENIFKETSFNYNFGIIHYNQNCFTYLAEERKSYIGLEEKLLHLIENLHIYFKFIAFLKSDNFADYYNEENKEIVIYTAVKGVLQIKIPNQPFVMNDNESISKPFSVILENLKNNDYKIHFKNQLFNIKTEKNKSLIENLVTQIEIIIKETDNNYQLQLKNFSFDKFKNDLQKEKERFFASLREILNKILSQVIAVPVSIAASTYATYKIESKFIFILITVALLIYVAFALYFQYLYYNDVDEIEKDFIKDFEKIEKNSGLQYNDISIERGKIERRISNIKTAVFVYCLMICLLLITYLIFMLNQVLDNQLVMLSDKVIRFLMAQFSSSN